MRVESRNPPAASFATEASAESAAWTKLAAAAWGRWLMRATARSCSAGAISTRRHPASRQRLQTDSNAAGSAAGVGVRMQTAPSYKSAEAAAMPLRSEPAIGCAPTNRPPRMGSSPSTIERFTLPASVAAASGGRSFASSGPSETMDFGGRQRTAMEQSRTIAARSVETLQPGRYFPACSTASARRAQTEMGRGFGPRRSAIASEPPMSPGPRMATGRLRERGRSCPSRGTSLRCRAGSRGHRHSRRRASGGW